MSVAPGETRRPKVIECIPNPIGVQQLMNNEPKDERRLFFPFTERKE